MNNLQFRVWKEDEWFLSEIVGKENEFYAQGYSYNESLSNLFSVMTEIEILKKEEQRESPYEEITFQHIPKEGITFNIPTFA